VPGPVDSRLSRGCHALIKDGAKLVESVDDVMAEFGPLADRVKRDDGSLIDQPAELLLNDLEQQVLQAIDNQPTSIDTIAATCGLPVHRVLSTISVLEMRRLVRRVSGTQVIRTIVPPRPR
jgi:DNA processing protein